MTALQPQTAFRRSTGILMTIFAAALFSHAAHAEDYVKSYTVANRATVHVDTNDGSVSVIAGDSKQVEFHVEYLGFSLDKTLHIDSNQQGDRVQLTARVAERFGLSWGTGRRLHIEVRMPKDADLQVETGDGRVEASSLSGNISVHTHDGSIRADHLSGTVELRTGDGSITANSLAGTVRLRTGDGSIEGSDLDGKLDADSGDGRIRLTGRFDALRVKSGDGSIDTRAIQGSTLTEAWSITTGSGSVSVALPSNLQADIDATSGDGHITLDMPVSVEGKIGKSQIHGKLNGGGQTLTIHTGDGSIRLRQA
jgi:hypothetical protein